MHIRIIIALLATCAFAGPAFAQAPPAAPLVLQLPATARAAALGDAWVTGRDSEVIFYNPAQIIGASRTFGVTLGRPGPGSRWPAKGLAESASPGRTASAPSRHPA